MRNLMARLFAVILGIAVLLSLGTTMEAYGRQDAAAADGAAAEGGDGAGTAEDAGGSGSWVPDEAGMISIGDKLFNNNCASCHKVGEKLVGPALMNIWERQDFEWIKNFIWNSAAVIQSGDEYAVNLYNEYNKTQMTAFPSLTEDEIMSILSYVQDETKKLAAAPTVTVDPNGPVIEGGGSGVMDKYFNLILVGFVVVLLLILGVLFLILSVLSRILKQRDDMDTEDEEIISQRFNVGAVVRSRPFLGLVTFIFVAIVVKGSIDALYTVGIQQGYQPTQPIAFSHKIHVGQYEIDCQYCHTGVRKSKNANIPSANICMNCHTMVKTESPEIQKIYKAIGYNPDDQTYSGEQKPIEWVRVHNLPDLSYFNHSQHVNVANLDCENCHGEVGEMEVIEQVAPLTMGWCIGCHRETEVNYKDNAYYDKLLEFHKSNNNENFVVEDIGGLECSKCHY